MFAILFVWGLRVFAILFAWVLVGVWCVICVGVGGCLVCYLGWINFFVCGTIHWSERCALEK